MVGPNRPIQHLVALLIAAGGIILATGLALSVITNAILRLLFLGIRGIVRNQNPRFEIFRTICRIILGGKSERGGLIYYQNCFSSDHLRRLLGSRLVLPDESALSDKQQRRYFAATVFFDYSFVPTREPILRDWIGRCWNYFNVY